MNSDFYSVETVTTSIQKVMLDTDDESESVQSSFEEDILDGSEEDFSCESSVTPTEIITDSIKSPITKSMFPNGDDTLYFPKEGEKGTIGLIFYYR